LVLGPSRQPRSMQSHEQPQGGGVHEKERKTGQVKATKS
jgi:hypothetical protein